MSRKRDTAASKIRPHPRQDYAYRVQLVQYRRGPDYPAWEARYRIDGAWSGWNSLGTTERDDAIFVSVDRLAEDANKRPGSACRDPQKARD